MRRLLGLVAACAIVGPVLGGAIAHDPVSFGRSLGLKIGGSERRELVKALVHMRSSLDVGISYAEFGARIGDIRAASAWVALNERAGKDDPIVKVPDSIVESLRRAKIVWDAKFPKTSVVCHMEDEREWSHDYCTSSITKALNEEGIKYDENSLRWGKLPVDLLVSQMLASASSRLDAAISELN